MPSSLCVFTGSLFQGLPPYAACDIATRVLAFGQGRLKSLKHILDHSPHPDLHDFTIAVVPRFSFQLYTKTVTGMPLPLQRVNGPQFGNRGR